MLLFVGFETIAQFIGNGLDLQHLFLVLIIQGQLAVFIFAVIVFRLLLDLADLLVHIADLFLDFGDLFIDRFQFNGIFVSDRIKLIIVFLIDVSDDFVIGLAGFFQLLLQRIGLFIIG